DERAEALWIDRPVDDDLREGLGGVEGDVGSGGPRRVRIDAGRLEAPLELFSVLAGRDDDPGLPGGEPVADEAQQGVGERRLFFVELNDVVELRGFQHGREENQ